MIKNIAEIEVPLKAEGLPVGTMILQQDGEKYTPTGVTIDWINLAMVFELSTTEKAAEGTPSEGTEDSPCTCGDPEVDYEHFQRQAEEDICEGHSQEDHEPGAFTRELIKLLDRFSASSVSGAPSPILAGVMLDSIKSFNDATVKIAEFQKERDELRAYSVADTMSTESLFKHDHTSGISLSDWLNSAFASPISTLDEAEAEEFDRPVNVTINNYYGKN